MDILVGTPKVEFKGSTFTKEMPSFFNSFFTRAGFFSHASRSEAATNSKTFSTALVARTCLRGSHVNFGMQIGCHT